MTLPIGHSATTKKTFAFVGVAPNPTGVGQQTVIRFGITDQLASTNYGWLHLTITITKPDNASETLNNNGQGFKTDSTGATYAIYTPAVAGNYTIQSHFPEQVNPAATSFIPANTTMLASDSDKVTLHVQEEPIKSFPNLPLPTEYWTRPINDQQSNWPSIGGNWLPATNLGPTYNRVAVGNDQAPKTAHILWAKPLTSGGLVGGTLNPAAADVSGARLEIGDAYEGKFLGSVIMLGRLYYDKYATADPFHEIVCVDLHTGEQLWSRVLLNNLTLTRGQVYNWPSIDLFGTYDYLWATGNAGTRSILGLPSTAGTMWCAFDPFTGDYVYTLYGVPSGTVAYGPNGELLVYTVNQASGYLTLWNSSNIPALYASTEVGSMGWGQWRPMGKVVNATGSDGVTLNSQPYTSPATPFRLNGYQLNATIPKGLPGSVQALLDDRIVGGSFGNTAVYLWAISLKKDQEGTLLYNTTWTPPSDWAAGQVSLTWQATSDQSKDGILVLSVKETRQNCAFSVETGQYLWTTEPRDALDFYTMGTGGTSARAINQIYDGKFYTGSYAGILYCFDAKSGDLLWSYTANNPYAAGANWGNWPLYPCFIAGGMIYIRHSEHSGYQQSLPPGAPFICLNASTGEEVWRVNGLFRGTHWGGYPLIGDCIIATMDTYDQRVYAIGRGPSAITLTTPDVSVEAGKTVVLKGTVMDVSPGTTADELTLRFPNGIAAVSDASISDWMLYLYAQFPRPQNATGVEVTLSVVDANGNYRVIGTTTSSSDGFYSFGWTPDIAGKYSVYAQFAGSDAYYPSNAESSFVVENAAATPTPTTQPQASMVEQYFVPAIAGIIVVVIVGFTVLALLMLRKKP
jgi:outer membrane protein assembly factor BamB